jgi:PAS domain S-box-containing protein
VPIEHATTSLDERFFSTLLKNLPGMAYRFANDGRWSMEYVSEGALNLTGWRPEELVGAHGRTIFNLAHPDDVMGGYEKVKAALAEQRPYLLTYRLIARDGRIKWVFEQGQGVFDATGAVEAVEGFISDITLQKEAQMALRKSEHTYRSIFENAVFGIFQSLPDGRFLTMNAPAARIIGYDDPDEAIYNINNIATDIYVDPEDRRRYLDAIRRDGQVSEWMSDIRHRDGRIVSIVENSRGVFDSEGELIYIEGTVKDITGEMAARAALHMSERRASELRAQLADAQLRALRLQLKPHFLFNVLNTVAMMIRVGETDKAQRMATLLGEMFRSVLEFEGEETVTLEQELKFCELYLNVQQYRFEDRLAVRREVDDDTLGIRVPTLMLQPIAENSITHGVAKVSGPCRVDIRARRKDNTLMVEISNDTTEQASDATDGHGIGVTNTRARLRELYGEEAKFDLVKVGRRMRAIVSLPIAENKK